MDRQSQPHDYASAAAMSYAQQQRPPPQQQFGFQQQPPPQQFPPPSHFMPPHPSIQQFPYPHHLQQPHAPPPPHPHFMQQQQPPPPFGPHFNAPIHAPPFPGGYDTPPPPAPPPADPELQKRIDKLVEYITKNGPEFEVMIREKQQDNPGYSFLFGGEGNNYYRYKLWLATHPPPGGPYNAPFAASGIHPHPPMPGMPHFAPFYDPHHQHLMGVPPRPEFDSGKQFKGMPGALPHEVVGELNNVLNGLNGTKESIKGAKIWFMQRAAFAPGLAEVFRERVFALDDSERQLHIVYLVNDILFDSLQRRMNPRELDNEALAFKPVLGSILARVYHNPQNKDENQSRLQKILQFWGSKEVYDQDTIYEFEGEMIGGPTTSSFAGPSKDGSSDLVGLAGYPQQIVNHGPSQWQPDRQGLPDQDRPDKHMPAVIPPSLGNQQFIPNSVPPGSFPGSIPINSAVPPVNQQPAPHLLQTPVNTAEKLPPYPLFPPGLIPGMVKKMQIGSGVPYSPLSPLDIPTIIPPSNVSPSEILERVSKFFKEIGEVNPSEGPMRAHSDDDDGYESRDSPVRKGGACIPPPPNLQVDPETGTYADGTVERKPGSSSSGRLGLGATADPNEVSQYDDVYTSYRKQRSSTYHSSMSARAAMK